MERKYRIINIAFWKFCREKTKSLRDMGVYHITYSAALKQVCLFFNEKCNFSCKGCVRKSERWDSHLTEDENPQKSNKKLSNEEVISYLAPLAFGKVIFLGSEPTVDTDFLSLAKELKTRFFTYNTLITNGYKYVQEKVIDEVCVSIKAVSPEIFKNFTAKNNSGRVLNNFKRYALMSSWLNVRAESIFIPGYIDKNEIEKISIFIASIKRTIPYRIDAYIPSTAYSFGKKDCFRRPRADEMRQAKLTAEKYLENVSILHKGVAVKNKVERVY